MSDKLPRGTLDRLWSDPANWPGFGIYYCKADPRLIVPKQIRSFGWTMNFAHGSVWGIILLMLVSAAGPALYVKGQNEAAVILFIVVWIVLLVVACHMFSSTRRHEDE